MLRRAEREPTEAQWPIVLCRKQQTLVTGGMQAGKSESAADHLITRYLETEGGNQLYWLIGISYDETEREFTYLGDAFQALGLIDEKARGNGRTTIVNPGRITLIDGTRIETKSAGDAVKLTRESPHGILACEASLLSFSVYERMRGRITPRDGWLFMSGTFERELGPWFRNLAVAWKTGAGNTQSFELPTWSNTYLFTGRDDPKIKALEEESSDEYFTERIAGRPMPPQGMVFPEFRGDLNVRNVEWDPERPIYIWEDPGYGRENLNAHAVEFAQIYEERPRVRVFDEIYILGRTQAEVIEMVKGERYWGKANEKIVVSDPYYADQHHSMNSVEEQWVADTGLRPLGDRTRVLERNERLKGFLKADTTFGEPDIVFDPRCEGILSEFGLVVNPLDNRMHPYRYKIDRDGQPFGDSPEDKYNHGIDATTNGLVQHFGYGYRLGDQVISTKRWTGKERKGRNRGRRQRQHAYA